MTITNAKHFYATNLNERQTQTRAQQSDFETAQVSNSSKSFYPLKFNNTSSSYNRRP